MEPKVMQNFLKLFLSFTLIILHTSFSNSVPLSWQSNSCASSCSVDPFLIRYNNGYTYYYSFETSSHVTLNSDNESPFVISGQLQVSSYGTCELGLQLSDVQIGGLNTEQQYTFKQALEANPLMFGFDDGRIVGVCPSVDDQDYVIDIKKSIISALQMSARSTSSPSIVMESDILGDCETQYIPEARHYSSIVIQKHKSLNTCSGRQQSLIGLFPRAFGVNEVLSRQTAPLLNASLVCTQTLEADIVKAVTCEETQSPYLWLKQKTTPSVVSSLRIRFLKQSAGLSSRRLATDSFSRHVLKMSEPKKINWYRNQYEDTDVIELLRTLCTQLEVAESGKGGAAKYIQRYFPEMVQALQQINDKNGFKRIHQSVYDKQLCSSQTMLYQTINDLWLDALALASNEPAMEILVYALQNNQISSLKAAYLFSLLAFAPDPTLGGVRGLLPLLDNKATQRNVVLGISSFVRNLREKDPKVSSDEVFGRVIEALVARVQSQARSSAPIEAIASIKALENVLNRNSQTQQQSRAQTVLLELAQDSALDNGVRSAAISALVEANADSSKWNDVIDRIVLDTRASQELRMNAYKCAVSSGLNAIQLKKILDSVNNAKNPKQNNNENENGFNKNVDHFSNYVLSHQKSIRESSDPFKRSLLPSDAPQFPAPERNSIFDFGVSRNIEYSYLNDHLNSGFVAESDVIYGSESQSESQIPIPCQFSFNTSIPFFGKQLQLIEFTFRQSGYDKVIESALKIPSKANYFKILSEIFESFKSEQQNNDQSVKSDNPIEKTKKKLMSIFKSVNNQQNSQPFAQIYLKIDGKSIIVFDLVNDFDKFEALYEQIRKQFEQRVQFERAIAMIVSDTRIRIPTLTGIPVEINFNASFAAALKANVELNDNLWDVSLRPSISGQMIAGIGLSVPDAQRGLVYVGEAWSAPVIDFKVDTRDATRGLQVKVNVPEKKQSIFGLKANQCVVKWKTKRTDDPNPRVTYPQLGGCSQTLSKALGLQVCANFEYPKPLLSEYGVFEWDITVEKSDPQLKSFDFSIEVPNKKQSSNEMRLWRVAFNTPNSQVNREMALEFWLNTPPQGKQEAKLSLQSPFKTLTASVALKNDEKERAIQIDVIHDSEKWLYVDAGVSQQARGQKREFRPRVKLQVYGQREPLVLQGSVSVSRGRKNSIQISLEGPEAGKQFLKGQFVREGERRSNDWRVSSDIALQMPEFVELRVAGVVDKAVKHVSTDLTFEYKFGKQMQKKETLKISAKAQNLTQTSLKKMSAFAEMTSSQYPQTLNAQFAYNLLSKSNEHLENEFTFSWAQALKNKFRILQVMKVLSDSNNKKQVENTFNIQVTPLNVDYEMRANVEKANSKPLKYSMEFVGKDKNGNKANDVRASVEYKHVSDSPLHVTLLMNAKSGSGYDITYSDDLKEMARGEFKGRTSVKWDKEKEASLDYVYKTKSDARAGVMHHELETELMTPKSAYPMKHTGLLRMTRDGFELKSRAHANGQQLYDFDSVAAYNNPQQNSRVALDVSSVGRGALEFNRYSVPRVASLELTSPLFGNVEHKSNFELHPRASISLNSQTKISDINVFGLDSHLARESPSRVVITTSPLNARVNYHPIKRAFELNAQTPVWSHESTVVANPVSRVLSVKSKHITDSYPFLEIDSEFAPKHKSFVNVNVADVGRLAFDANLSPRAQRNANLVIRAEHSGAEHNSKLLWGKSGTKFVSKSLNGMGSPVLSIDYNHDPEDSRHTLNCDTNAFESRLDAQYVPHSDDNSLKFALKSSARAPHQYSHNTELKLDSNAYIVSSRTQNRNKNIATIDASLARDITQYPSNVRVNVLNTRSQLQFNPRESAKFEFNNPSIVDHVSQFDYKPYERSYELSSRSRTPNSNQYNINALYSRDSKSQFSTQLPSFDASFHFQPITKSAKFEFTGKRANNAYNHVTDLSMNPQQYSLQSRTNRQSNGQNVLSLDGLLANKKSFGLKYLDGQHVTQTKLDYNGLDNEFNVYGRHQQYTHTSNAKWNDKSVKVMSKTDYEPNNSNVHKLDASIALNPYVSASHVSFVAPNLYAGLNHSPQERNAKFELRTDALEHHTSLAHNARAQEYQLKSLTVNANNKQRLFELNSALAPQRVNIALESPGLVNSKLVLENSRGDKSGQFDINFDRIPRSIAYYIPNNGESLNHKTDLSLSDRDRAFQFNSQTLLGSRVLSKLNARYNQPNGNLLSVETPSFMARTQFEDQFHKTALPRVELEFRNKQMYGRHVLASIAGINDNGVEVDIAWDKANDANNRLVLTLNIEQNRNGNSLLSSSTSPSDLVTLKVDFRQNILKLLLEMNTRSLLSGPHTLSLSWQPQSGDIVQITANHNWNFRDHVFSCESAYSVGGVMQFSAKLDAKQTPKGGYRVELITSSPNDNTFDYEFGGEGLIEENGIDFNANIWAKNGASNAGNIRVNVYRDQNRRDKRIENALIKFMVNNVEQSRLSLSFDLDNPLDIDAKIYTMNTEQIAVETRAARNAISFNLLSNYKRIPSYKALALMEPELHRISFIFEKNSIRILELNTKMSGSYYNNDLNCDLLLKTKPFSLTANAKRLSNHLSANTELILNDKTLFSASFSAENQRNSANNWVAKGHIVANEAELARVSLEQSFGSNELQYALRASSEYAHEFSPMSVVIAKKTHSNDRQYTVEMCAKSDQTQCLRSQIDIEFARDTTRVIQRLVISVSKPKTDVQFEYALNAEQKLSEGSRNERSLLDTRAGQTYKTYGARRSALVLTVNSHALGAELLIPERARQGIDGQMKLLFPSSRVFTSTVDIVYTNTGYVARVDITKNLNEVLVSLNGELRRSNDLFAKLEMSSPKFNRNPKQLSFVWKEYTNTRPFDIRIESDLSSVQNNALIIESYSTYNSDTNNRTVSLIVTSRDRRIDFNGLAHMALGHTAGIQWQNVNRNGRQTSGYYFAEKDIQNAFNVIINDDYRIRAQISDNWLQSTYTLYNKRHARESGHLRVQFDDTCALFEVSRDSLSPASSFRACLDDNQRHLLVISTELKQNANSIADSKIELDTRSSQQILRFAMNWSPQVVARALEKIAEQDTADILRSFPLLSDSEIYRELVHKWQQLWDVLTRDAVYPVLTVLSDECEDVLQELSKQFPPLVSLIERVSLNYEQLVDQFNDIVYSTRNIISRFVLHITPTVISDAIRQYSRLASRALRNTCVRNSNTCYQFVYAYDRYGFEGVVQLSLQKVYESARQTHRFAMTTIGQMNRILVEFNRIVSSNIDYLLDTRVGQWLSQYTRDILNRVYDASNDLFERIINYNDDTRRLYDSITELVRELSQEFDSIDWSRVRQAINDAIRTILTPESSTRVLLWEPQNGRVMFEVRAPVIHKRLRAIMTSDRADKTSLIDSVQSWFEKYFDKKSDANMMTSYGDNKYSKKYYKDMKDYKNINVVTRALWSEWRLLHRTEASHVTRVNKLTHEPLELTQTRVFELRLNNNMTSLEIIDGTRVYTNDDTCHLLLSVDTRSLQYNTSGDTCVHYNSHDIRVTFEANTIHVNITSHVFGMFWIAIEFNAKREMLSMQTNDETHAFLTFNADNDDVTAHTSDGTHISTNHATCRRWLSRVSHSLSNTSWWSPWLRGERAREACQSSRDLCDFSAVLVPRVPHECFKCNEKQFGFRMHVKTRPIADVLFVIGCELSAKFQTQIKRLAKQITREFRSRDVNTRFMALIGNNGNAIQIWPKFEKELNFHLFENSLIHSTNDSLSFDWLTMMTSLPFRTEATRHLIIWTCNECVERHIDFVSARVHILTTPSFVHVIASNGKRVLNRRSKKWRQVIGCDHEWAYLASGQRSRELRDHAFPPKDVCVSVAMETNGTYWTRRNTRAWRQTVATRVADNTLAHTCVSCDCVETRDRATAEFDCRLCDTRVHTLKANNEHVIGVHANDDEDDYGINVEQEWFDEDDRDDDEDANEDN